MLSMSFFIDHHNLHHAYLIVGERNLIRKDLFSFLEDQLSFSLRANPDFWIGEHEVFTIDDARMLTTQHERKSFSGGRKIFVIFSDGITIEAQNALLKLFEEPIVGNHFFLVMSEDKDILPTLRSRVQTVAVTEEEKTSKEKEQFGRKFLSSSIGDRMKLVSSIAESKDKVEAKRLIRSLIDTIHSECSDERSLLRMTPVLEDLMKTDDYLSDRSPSIKILLEHIASSAPHIS